MEHSPTSATGTGWEPNPSHATQRAASDALKRRAWWLPESAIRLTVRNKAGQRAATWKCRSPSGQEDVICRDINETLKTTLYQSGRRHIAYFEGFFEQSVLEEQHGTGPGRFIDTWDALRRLRRA